MNEDLQKKLLELGLTDDQVKKLSEEGVKETADMASLSSGEVKAITGCGLVVAKKVAVAFAPAPTTPTPADLEAEIPEGKEPNETMVRAYAKQIGLDPMTLMMFMSMGSLMGSGVEEARGFDISQMLPSIDPIVRGYRPKVRNIAAMIMGQIEDRLGYPIVVINDDGSVNADHTITRIMELEEGRELTKEELSTFYDKDAVAFDVIKVGVDAQSIYDCDPINPGHALSTNNIGLGRVKWNNIPMPLRQVLYYAATATNEIGSDNETKLSWLRTNLKPEMKVGQLQGEFPEAVKLFREHNRLGDLPTLKVQLTRSPRRPEMFPRRRPLVRPPVEAGAGAEHRPY